MHGASIAKVNLFTDLSREQAPVAVPSRGSSLLAKTVSTKLNRATLEQVILDGFFPLTKVTDLPGNPEARVSRSSVSPMRPTRS